MMGKISAELILRLGIAFTLLYAALSSFLTPINWIGFFPAFLFRFGIPEELLLGGFSLFEAALGLWLLWGKKVVYPALLSAFAFGSIALFNLGAMDILFRDVGLFFAALALAKLAIKHD
ncbi:hypothetical protein IIB49_02495 [Patescibacteria group bacterium]|nr:hypothetical protein [Patescibacteria group bacterium]